MSTYTQPALWVEPAPDTLELSFSWADGDTSQEQLERIVGLLRQHGTTCRDDSGKLHLFRVLETRIEDGHIIATCCENVELERELGMFRNQFQADEDEID